MILNNVNVSIVGFWSDGSSAKNFSFFFSQNWPNFG